MARPGGINVANVFDIPRRARLSYVSLTLPSQYPPHCRWSKKGFIALLRSYAENLLFGECVLVAIDVQSAFLQKLETKASIELASRIAWTLGAAAWFGVPIVVTAEDVPRLGGVIDEVAGRLAARTVVYNKMSFDLTADPDIVAAIRATGKQTAMLLGLETDVCVAQSAIGLLGLGYRVVAACGRGIRGSSYRWRCGAARLGRAPNSPVSSPRNSSPPPHRRAASVDSRMISLPPM